MDQMAETKLLKSFIGDLGIDLAGIADMSRLIDIPMGWDIDRKELFTQYPFAIVMGAQVGRCGRGASGDETALYLEKIAYDVMAYLEKKQARYLVIHPEDEYDPDRRMGLFSLKVMAKAAGLGWQGRSLLIVSPVYGPIHRLIAVLTNLPLQPDQAMDNQCHDCTVCVESCPTNSLNLCRFEDHPPSREAVLDITTCLGNDGCMVCILKCPYLRQAKAAFKIQP